MSMREVHPSLHRRIVSELSEKILKGDWPPGMRIPFEHELTRHYQCARMTVNKALQQLAQLDLIERRRKAGSFVKRPVSQSAILQINDIQQEVLELKLIYRFEVLFRLVRKWIPEDRIRIDLRPKSEVLEIRCLHFAQDQPFCVEDRLINLELVPQARDEYFDQIAPGSFLTQHVPWTMARHQISSIAASASLAERLAIKTGAPCLAIERATMSSNEQVTVVNLIYPGHAHKLVAHFTPNNQEKWRAE